ncbi:MAG: hypothetical protein ACR2F6_11050 [Mycobacteriales bacterium]
MSGKTSRARAATDPVAPSWVPRACTLPTVEQPLRVAEFDELFATALHDVQRLTGTRLRLIFDLAAEVTARELTARESECCSFFTFFVTPVDAEMRVEVDVPAAHAAVLDALARRAAAALEAAA